MQAENAVARRMTATFTETLGEWRVRVVMIGSDDEGNTLEPYVVEADVKTLDLAGLGWQASALLYESWRLLDAALRDGYE